jgi:hypothetical protein
MVEDRYNTLKAEYDKLRGKYREDIKHWQEWKAADTARKEEKKKKKEMKKSTPRENPDGEIEHEEQGVERGMETVTLVPPSQESASASQCGSQRVTRSQAKKRKADDRSDFEGNRVAETIFPAPVIPSLQIGCQKNRNLNLSPNNLLSHLLHLRNDVSLVLLSSRLLLLDPKHLRLNIRPFR